MPTRELHAKSTIRPATPADASAISALVIRTLRETNAKFYSAEMIESVAANFSVEQIALRLEERIVLVATIAGDIVGTASLQQAMVRTVFVRPDRQGQGIGAALMTRILEIARDRALDTLTVPSSINAESFYRKLGFAYVCDRVEGGERIIMMSRAIARTGLQD